MPQDLTREMAKEWQSVSEEERKICDDIAAQNKADYEEAMKLYHAQMQAGAAGVLVGVAGGDEVRFSSASVCRCARADVLRLVPG